MAERGPGLWGENTEEGFWGIISMVYYSFTQKLETPAQKNAYAQA